jgi:hypothetical protein
LYSTLQCMLSVNWFSSFVHVDEPKNYKSN